MTIDAPPWLEAVQAKLLKIMAKPTRRHKFDRLQVEWGEEEWLARFRARYPLRTFKQAYFLTFSVHSETASEKAAEMLTTELMPHLHRQAIHCGWKGGKYRRWWDKLIDQNDCEWTVTLKLRKNQ